MPTTLEELIITLETQGADKVQSAMSQTARAVRSVGQAANTAGQQTGSIFGQMQGMSNAVSGFRMPVGGGGVALANPMAGGNGGILGMLGNMGSGAGGGAGGGMMGLAAAAGPLGIAIAAFQQIAQIAGQIVAKFEEAWKQALAFSKEFLAIKSLTGASDKDAIGIQNRFTAAGLPAQMAERVTERMEMAVHSSRGAAALGKLHIDPRGRDGAALINETFQALSKLPDGLKKTRIETDLLGARLAISVQQMMNFTAAQQANMDALQNAFSGDSARAINEAQKSMNILGETIMQRIILPIMGKAAPVLEFFADKLAQVIDVFAKINDAMGGALGNELALIVGAVGAVIVALAVNIGLLATALEALLYPIQHLFQEITNRMKSLGMEDTLKKFGIDISGDRYKDPMADRALKAAERSADALEDIKGKIIGGGERSNNVKTDMELEYAIAHGVFGGLA